MKRYFPIVIALFLIAFISFYYLATNTKEGHKGHEHKSAETSDLELSGEVKNGIRVIDVKASRYKFEPDPIVVNLGEKVRLTVTSTDVTHGIAISEFNVKVSLPMGKTENVEFVADKKGAFHAYCSVYCGAGHSHMHANFIVK